MTVATASWLLFLILLFISAATISMETYIYFKNSYSATPISYFQCIFITWWIVFKILHMHSIYYPDPSVSFPWTYSHVSDRISYYTQLYALTFITYLEFFIFLNVFTASHFLNCIYFYSNQRDLIHFKDNNKLKRAFWYACFISTLFHISSCFKFLGDLKKSFSPFHFR